MSDTWAFVQEGVETWEPVTGASWFRDLAGNTYPAGWLAAASLPQKQAIGLQAVAGPGAVPAGMRAIGVSRTVVAGKPVASHILASISKEDAIATKVAAIDAERDRRDQLDFAFDFGATIAVDDYGEEIAAGVRQLQMSAGDQVRWNVALSLALAAPDDTVLPIRAEDNWNIQTTALQVRQLMLAMAARNTRHLFNGGRLKTEVRACDSWATATAFDITAGWEGEP